ncbi:NapC/NirT family cytochrome c [Bacillus sp. EB106-08-02-XG196]|uniref:NapC/NirT family cytochrome c n=1 Tax=Bacillus sp. EB106-08-02-XG196 TaxID=2737049 RepID=UPI0015C495D8|nr:NapC/NirT family cytochrome c [Bacillus sp. EB106-08-02-XG196]NWQ39463.1 NapC/NirT family cytochrome c [Bacillus sp. EB106-08-02-XG196]
MEEEHKELPAPPRFRNRIFKIMTLTVLFLGMFFFVSFAGLKGTSSSEFCASCHEMKPEFYTWKASSHSEVDCVSCHIEPGLENLAKSKAEGVVELYKKTTKTYTAPIRMPDEIPDSACETCHNVSAREVTPSGDLIIPHDKHKTEGVECIQCHSGTAHGKIADRKMTFQADYAKWDEKVGTAAMAEIEWIRPDMDTCMECHKARKVTTECTACHTTGMVPESHKKGDFKLSTHGKQASTDLKDCNQCHKDMSSEPLSDFEEVSTLTKYLNNNKEQVKKKTHYDYAKANTYCRDCHSQRPQSHGSYFLKEHGELATQNKEKCLACHEIQRSSNSAITQVACGTCHPSSHTRNKEWRKRHPIPVSANQKLTESCFRCHSETTCKACHQDEKDPE